MICARCGAANEPGRKFCGDCGARLSSLCPGCGSPNPPSTRFCGECGTALAEAPATPEPERAGTVGAPGARADTTGPVTERRLVSVLFADLVGFTAASESRDPESVREFLTRYFDLCREIVARYGGSIEKFIGDAVMAVWGTPVAHEDDAERAVRAALDLSEAIGTLTERDDRVQLRVAVLTGEAAVTIGATGQGMVAGDLVNTASRLQSVAPPGDVLVGETTYRSASGAIAFEPVPDQVLRGKTLPVPAWRALRVVAKRGGAGRAERLEAPFVGRDRELRLLKELLHTTAQERRARLVSVTGQAGIGKSRLAWEFLKYIDGLTEDIYWHEGRSPAYGQGVTFWALGEMVRRRAGIAETDDDGATRRKLTEALGEYVSDESERRWIEPKLLHLLGLEDGQGGEREELFSAWRTFFERVADRGPTVLVFEDLQWADPGLLDFIDHVLDWSRTRRILIVTLARPELLERRADWGGGRRNFVAISLEPLSDASMTELLDGLAPGLPRPVARSIVARAEGVPLYAVETVRMLLQQGRLTEEEGVYRLVGELTGLEIPETLQALIAARLDALDPAARALLQAAAVIGQTFTVSALAGVTGDPAEAVEPRLRDLVRRELLVFDSDPRSPERGQYAFVQALVRDVAYNTLAKRDRRIRHLAAARYFEALGEDELAGVLASHYFDAYRAAPDGPEAMALAAQALIALVAAADRAEALRSHDQARTYLEQALELTSDPGERAGLLERIAAAARNSARFDVAERHLRQAIDLYAGLGDEPGRHRAIAQLGAVLVARGSIEPAIEMLEAALRMLGDAPAKPALVTLTAELGRAYMNHEEPQRAVEWSDRALVQAERLDLVPDICEALTTRSTAVYQQGRVREGTAGLIGAIAIADRQGATRAAIRARLNLSYILASDDPERGLTIAREGYDLAQKLGSREFSVYLLGNATNAAFRTGAWDWAVSAIEELPLEDLEPVNRAELMGQRGVIRACRGEEHEIPMPEFESFVAASTDLQAHGGLALIRAQLAFARSDLDDVYDEAMAAAEQTAGLRTVGHLLAAHAAAGARDPRRMRTVLDAWEAAGAHGVAIEAGRRTAVAGMAALEGRQREAVTAFVDAARRWRELGVAWELALCQLAFVMLLGREGPEAEAAASEARDILTRLRARPFLERLERALAPSDAVVTDDGRSEALRTRRVAKDREVGEEVMPS